MGFSGIGMWEIIFVLVIALIIWGPNKLPEIARTIGKAVRVLKKASFDLTAAVTREIEESQKTPSPTRQNPKTTEPPSDTSKTAGTGTLKGDSRKNE